MVGLGNPKTILFFLALFPQFIDPTKPVWTQSLFLGAITIVIDFGAQTIYALAGGMMSKALSRNPMKRWFQRGIGGAFMGLAVVAATIRRAA